jgi:hypothetical protein
MSKVSKAYKILANKEDPAALFRVKLLKATGFAGVEIEYTGVIMADESAKNLSKEDKVIHKELKKGMKASPKTANNAHLKYNVAKVPARKFQNMKDSKKAEFEKVVGDVFIDAIMSAVKTEAEAE